MKFLIYGLPRSRTAWLANFFTSCGLYCYHEGINGCSSIAEYKRKIGDDGDSGTGIVLFDRFFPDAKKIVIEADGVRARQFSEQVFGDTQEALIEDLKDRLSEVGGLHVKFEEIDQRIREIWAYITDKPFDGKRFELLRRLNVQVCDPTDIDREAAFALLDGEIEWLG